LYPEGKELTSVWMYEIIKEGIGENFFEALDKAIEAQEVEIAE